MGNEFKGQTRVTIPIAADGAGGNLGGDRRLRPWDASLNEFVMRTSRIHTGATLPVLVNPSDPTELMIDWFAGVDA